MQTGYGKNMVDSGDDELLVDLPVDIPSLSQDQSLLILSHGSGTCPSLCLNRVLKFYEPEFPPYFWKMKKRTIDYLVKAD